MHACVTISLCVSEHLITISTLQSSRTESTWFNHLHQRLVACIISKQNPILVFNYIVLGCSGFEVLNTSAGPNLGQTRSKKATKHGRHEGFRPTPQAGWSCPKDVLGLGGLPAVTGFRSPLRPVFAGCKSYFLVNMIGSYWVLVTGSSLKQHFWLGEQWPQQKANISVEWYPKPWLVQWKLDSMFSPIGSKWSLSMGWPFRKAQLYRNLLFPSVLWKIQKKHR